MKQILKFLLLVSSPFLVGACSALNEDKENDSTSDSPDYIVPYLA